MYGTGLILDGRARRATAAIGSAARVIAGALTPEAELPDEHQIAIPSVQLNQGRTNACMGHFLAHAVRLWCDARGIGAPTYSPFFPYWWARRGVLRRDTDVRDNGCGAFGLIRAVDKHGLVPLEDFRPSLSQINEPTPDWLDIAAQAVTVDLRGIYVLIGSMMRRVRDSISKNQPCLITVHADAEQWQPDDGPKVIRDVDPTAPLHAVTAYKYRTIGGERQVGILNSWRKTWRGDGTVWLAPKVIEASPFVGYVNSVAFYSEVA